MGEKASKAAPEGPGRTLDQEEQPQPLRLQEPYWHRPSPQVGAVLVGHPCLDP